MRTKGVGPRALGSPLKQTLTDKHGNKISKQGNNEDSGNGSFTNINGVGKGGFNLVKKPTSGVKIGPYEAFLSLSGDKRQEEPGFVAPNPKFTKNGKLLPYSAR